ncbi:glycine zipper domain-containing protein [Neobacillus ginsengisoli]|uniref:Outer membrane lipoprotein SlyB n=1 Tax=Neobacillus ginsengisoli TaxID=904295 RepID=A0ABT9XU83_9BACI|nr:glycine zipper domain-containing protein [Neobacillus ginsengisoli]MDQ0199114.1 outer membrane lipoprotein SlyB [Neobacillus ginsengisoli]
MFKGASLWAGLISGAMAQLKDTHAMTSGHMNKKEYAIQTSKNVTGSLGTMAGIEYGAILGSSVLPGPGTILGALIGSMVGNWIGNYAGHHAGHIVFNNQIVINNRLTVEERPKLT